MRVVHPRSKLAAARSRRNYSTPRPARASERPTADQLLALELDDTYAVVRTDREFRVTGWSRGAQLLYGWTPEEATGRHISQLVKHLGGWRDPAVAAKGLEELARTGSRHEISVTRRGKDRVALFDSDVFAYQDGYVGINQGEVLEIVSKTDTRFLPQLATGAPNGVGYMPKLGFDRESGLVVRYLVEMPVTQEPTDNRVATNIGAQLRKIRKARDLRQEDLAERTGVTQKDISRWETGHNMPRSHHLEMLVVAFDLPDWSYFFGSEDPPAVDPADQ